MKIARLILCFTLLIIAESALADTTWVPAGDISGTWDIGGSPFMIYQDHVTVATNDTLLIGPGVKVEFTGHYKFNVNGLLQAIGTEQDSIYFATDLQNNPNGWWGIRFYSAHDSCCLEYCVIENGITGGSWPSQDANGGGIYCSSSSPVSNNCRIRRNSCGADGGGIFCIYSPSASFINCEISSNQANDHGGGITCGDDASPLFTNCTILSNHADGDGGGLYFYSSYPSFWNCIIRENTADDQGGGMRCWGYSSAGFIQCTFVGNSGSGGGVYCEDSSPSFSSSIFAFSSGSGITFDNSPTSHVAYCNFFDNSGGDIVNPSQGPPGIGVVDTTNANGEPSDVYFNIFCDPMFVDVANYDYHLTASSCCIDAGNPCQLDPDTTVSDIGAYYFHHSWPDYDPSKEIYICYSVEETGRYVSWRPFANATGYKLYRTTQVDLPLNQWDLVTTTSPAEWDYLDTEDYDSTQRYFYSVAVLY